MKFLFCPLASDGFVFPLIPIARELRDRGHEVAFVTSLEYHQLLADVGLPRIPRGQKDGPSFQVPTWFKPLSVAMQYRHIEYALQQFPADAMVTSVLCLGPLFVREVFEVPCAAVGFLPYLWPTADDSPEPTNGGEQRRRWRHDDMLRYYNEARALFKMELVDPIDAPPDDSPFLVDLFLQRSIPALTPRLNALPELVHLIGPCVWEPSENIDPELIAWLDDSRLSERPVLYVQHGRSFGSPSFWPHLVRNLAGRDIRVAASTGRMDAPTGEPPDDWFLRPLVQQHAVMAQAEAVIASGNTTVALGALLCGLPSLYISGGGEQADVAQMLVAAGAALAVDATQVEHAPLAELIDQVMHSESLRQCARALQRDLLAARDGFVRAADLIEQLGQTEEPVTRANAAS